MAQGYDDPDILLLKYGGFAYFNKEGTLLGVVSFSNNASQHCAQFAPPESLQSADAIMYASDILHLIAF